MARTTSAPTAGQEVCYSAAYLRQTCRQAYFGDGHKRGDLLIGDLPNAIGVLIGFNPGWPELAFVCWDHDPEVARPINVGNIIRRADKSRDANHETHRPNMSHEAA